MNTKHYEHQNVKVKQLNELSQNEICRNRPAKIHVPYAESQNENSQNKTKSQIETKSGPGVYIFKQADCFLYVGCTRELLKRPKKRDKGHESRWQAILECDSCELISCESFVKAQQLEEQLIRKHSPKYNLRIPCAEADLARTWQMVKDNW